MLKSLIGVNIKQAIQLGSKITKNKAKYEA